MLSKKHRIRVLHISASSAIGGGPEHVWQLVKHLPHPIASYIAAPDSKPYASRFAAAVGQERMVIIQQRRFSLAAFWRVFRFIQKHQIQIIHSHGKGAGIYGRLLALITHAQSVHTFHGVHLPQKKIPQKLYIFLERVLCRISKVCINVSKGEQELTQKLQWFSKQATVIYNGVQVPETMPQRPMPKPFTILHISRFDQKPKNSLFVLPIAHALQEKHMLSACTFVLIGDGEQRLELEQAVHTTGFDHIFQFLGQQDCVQPFFANAGCLLSTSHYEGMPLAVLEAKAHGVPAVVSDVMGNRDAIEHACTGLLYTPGKAACAADAIIHLMTHEKEWHSMCAQAHAQAKKHFTIQNMALATAKVYENTVEAKI